MQAAALFLQNSYLQECAAQIPVSVAQISDDALRDSPELVRTFNVQPPMGTGQVRLVKIEGVDVQPCGGTHVANTTPDIFLSCLYGSEAQKKQRAF